MASIRERKPGVWEVRAFTGNDAQGRPTQSSRTVRGTKKDAQRVAAQLTLRPNRNAGGRKVADLLAEWIEFNSPTWAPLTLRDQTSRAALIKADAISQQSVASVGVADIDRWVTRLRFSKVGESSIRNQHSVLEEVQQLEFGIAESLVGCDLSLARINERFVEILEEYEREFISNNLPRLNEVVLGEE